MKICTECNQEKSLDEFWKHSEAPDGKRSKCGECLNRKQRERYHKDPNKKSRDRAKALKKNYGMSVDDYNELLIDQGGRCAICGDPPPKPKNKYAKKHLVVDHDHTTGKVRGLLCDKCNRCLGLMKDNVLILLRAIEYLETRSN